MQGELMHDDARHHKDVKKKITSNYLIGDFFFPGRYKNKLEYTIYDLLKQKEENHAKVKQIKEICDLIE
jgi:hypothetical protein